MKGIKRWLYLCYFILMLSIGVWYFAYYYDFGKSIVGVWGVLVSCVAVLGGIDVRTGSKKGVALCGSILTAAQIPAIYCWFVFVSSCFAGMPGCFGLTMHILSFVLGLIYTISAIRQK